MGFRKNGVFAGILGGKETWLLIKLSGVRIPDASLIEKAGNPSKIKGFQPFYVVGMKLSENQSKVF